MDYISIIKKGILITFIIAIFIIVGKLFVFYIPFLIAYIISLIIEPTIQWISKKTKLTRKVSSVIVLATIFLILISIIVWGIISLISEATNLLSGLNTYLEKSVEIIIELASKINLDKLKSSVEISKILEDTATNFISQITEFIKGVLNKFL